MKNKFLLFIITSLIFISCSEQVIEQGYNSNEVETIYAKINDFMYDINEFTRTNISIGEGQLHSVWAATDTIGIFSQEGNQIGLPMASSAGSTSAIFTGGGWGLKSTSTYAAYFPLIGQYYLDKTDIPVHYTGQVQEGNASTAHLGVYDYLAAPASEVKNGGVSFDFERLGCLVQIQLTVPSPTTIYSVTLKAENEAFAVKGKVDLTESSPRIYPVASSSEIMLEVKNVTTAKANQVATFYMMLPPTDLSGKTLKAVVSVENGSKEVSLASKNFQAGKAYALSATLGDDWISETDYVDLKFGMTGVATSYNTGNGSLSITYPSGSLPNVKVGSATVLPAQYGFDIRVIESVNTSGNTISMQTSQGNMSNLFRNTSFTLTTDASATRSAEDKVYTPTAYGYVDEAGKYHEVYNIENGTRAVYPIEQFKWGFERDYKGEVIYSGKAGKLSWDECKFSAGLKGTFTFDFGMKQISEVRAVGDLKKIEYKISGNMDMDMLLHYNYEYEYKESGDEIIQYNAIPMGQFTFRVPIGGVPVPVHLQIYTHLGRMYACHIEGKLDATAGVEMSNEVSIGLEWTPENGAKPIREIKPTFEFHPLTVEAEASAEAKVSYYPQWEIGLYRFKAIWLEPRPYLKEKVEAGFRASTDGNNYIGWKAETYNGMDIRMGLETDFGFWRKDVWTSDIYNCIKDRLLFEAPAKITTLSPKDGITVKEGESINAEFIVESFSPITNKYYPCPWALVNFEPESGNLDNPLVITNVNGKASVVWTPEPNTNNSTQTRALTEDRKLTAKVVDKEGKSIDESTITVKVEDELREALIKLYKSTNGDNWIRNDNWCSEKPITEWYGVKIHPEDDERIIITLFDNNLTGKIEQKFPEKWKFVIQVGGNKLDCINLSGCRTLMSLNCSNNPLTSLDISTCTALVQLYCTKTLLTSLDVSGYTALKDLQCEDCQLTSLNVSGCTALEWLDCCNNQLTSLDASGCTALENLQCLNNPLASLNLSGCTPLYHIEYEGCPLISLNLSGCTELKRLYIREPLLTSLNVSGCTALESLDCINDQLISLNASGCTALEYLQCSDNQLTSLNVSGCTALENLRCSDNQLTSLNVSGCTALKSLQCDNNKISSVIPKWFSQLEWFIHDIRYSYYYENGVKIYTDKGYGWWYPGEPQKGYHAP